MLITLFNFQNFGSKQPAKIQLFILRISQKTSYWEVMEQTKLNLATVWWIVRKTCGKLELTIMDTLNWPILQLRSFWQQHLQTPLKLTKVCKYYKTSWISMTNSLLHYFIFYLEKHRSYHGLDNITIHDYYLWQIWVKL